MKPFLTFLLLPLCMAASAQSKSTPVDPKLLIGKWRSVDDKSSRIEFTANTETEYYEKEVMGVSTYSLKGDKLTSKDRKSGEIYRYSVVELTAKTLSLLYSDRGNTLRYKRE